MQKQLCGKNEMCLVDAREVKIMQQVAEHMMESTYEATHREGKTIKWVLESLDLWEEDEHDHSKEAKC